MINIIGYFNYDFGIAKNAQNLHHLLYEKSISHNVRRLIRSFWRKMELFDRNFG